MMLRRSVLLLPALVLAACMEHPVTGPEALTDGLAALTVVHEVQNLNDDGFGSLREAVDAAGHGHVITFAPALSGDTIFLLSTLSVTRSIMIVGPSGGITISGSGVARVFNVTGTADAVFDNLTITGGFVPFSPAFGGGIRNSGSLTIRNSTLQNNWAANTGGAIDNNQGSLTIINSTIANNGVHPFEPITGFAGGIQNFRGTVLVVNSTITGNTAVTSGGGIRNTGGTITLIHSTVTNNGANSGGGIYSVGSADFPAVTNLVNSIVARNSAGPNLGPDIRNFSDLPAEPEDHVTLNASHTLIGNPTSLVLTEDVGNITGVDPAFEEDVFGKPKLADNGGVTHTHALLAGSLAINAAAAAPCTNAPVSSRDQRGIVRPQGGACDMGAFEFIGAPAPPTPPSAASLVITPSGTINRKTGAAIISGTMTCVTPGLVQLRVTLGQQQKTKNVTATILGSTTLNVACNGATAWAAAITATNGTFTNSMAQAAAETLNIAPALQDLRSVQMFWSK